MDLTNEQKDMKKYKNFMKLLLKKKLKKSKKMLLVTFFS